MEELQQQIDMLKKAHQRLFNQYANLQNDLENSIKYNLDLETRINHYLQQIMLDIDEIKSQPKKEFIPGNTYSEFIEELVSQSENVEWKKRLYRNIDIKFKGRNEVYSAFVDIKYLPTEITKYSNTKIKFEYKDDNKIKITNFI